MDGVAFGFTGTAGVKLAACREYWWFPITRGVCPPSRSVTLPSLSNRAVMPAKPFSVSSVSCRCASSPESAALFWPCWTL